jgi:nibrin
VKWNPVTFSFALLGKKRLSENPIDHHRERLGPLDIKTMVPYTYITTHVVAEKRNTPEGLNALIDAKWVVTEEYLDAIARVATSEQNPENPEEPLPSLLEKDFDTNWPKEIQYLPPTGKEPVPRPVDTFLPDKRRKEVFKGYTFVFGDEHQYDKLQPCIESGGGRAVFRPVMLNETSVEDYARFVKSIAGESSDGEFEYQGSEHGIVVVRTPHNKGFTEWQLYFEQNLQLRLGMRSVEQSEFLDAICVLEPQKLRRQLLPAEVEYAENTPAPFPSTAAELQ